MNPVRLGLLAAIPLLLGSALALAGGALDTTFDSDGKKIVDFAGNHDFGYSVIQQSDGKLVVAGETDLKSTGAADIAVTRFNLDGSRDTSFNGTGKRTIDLGANDYATSVVQQSDGRLVIVGGSVNNSGVSDIAVTRLTASGALDTTFNGTGKLSINLGSDEAANAVIQQKNGKLLLIGSSGTSGSGAHDIVVIRLNANGSFDTTFSGNGIATLDFGQDDYGYDIIQQSDGKLVLSGATGNHSTGAYDVVVMRLTSAGAGDTTFNGNGVRAITFGDNDSGESLVQLSNGKLVVVGSTVNLTTNKVDMLAARLNADGSLDTLFGSGGKKTIDMSSADNYAYSVIQQSDGKLVIAGKVLNSSGIGNLAVVRLKSNGGFDTNFNTTGKKTIDFGGDDYGSAVILQADGGLVIAGGTTKGANSSNDMAIVRLSP